MSYDIEICRDLKRLAGIVHKEGWTTINGREPVGGHVTLTGPMLLYDSYWIELGALGCYTRKQIQEAHDIMYGRENLPKPSNYLVCLESSNLHEKLISRFIKGDCHENNESNG